jgi:hypothetical protein
MRLSDSDSIPKWVDSPFIARVDVAKIQDEETTVMGTCRTDRQVCHLTCRPHNGYNCEYEIQESNETIITTWRTSYRNLATSLARTL